MVLLLGLTAGMRVTEIAQIEVQDVLFPSGALRDEISLRAAITKDAGSGASTSPTPRLLMRWTHTWSIELRAACARRTCRAVIEA